MQNHVKVYLKHFNLTTADTILCQVCQSVAIDVHHLIPRSKFGSKRKHEQDSIENLIALCRTCHEKAHAGILTKEYLKEIHNKKLNGNN